MKDVRRQYSIAIWPRVFVFGIIALLAALGSCGHEDGSHDVRPEMGFRFGMRGDPTGTEDFIAMTFDQRIIATARAQLNLPDSARDLHINGPIERGDGGHNLEWSWHFIASQWILTGSSIELCDGGPLAVENDLDYWVDTVKTFCPWSSYVKAEVR